MRQDHPDCTYWGLTPTQCAGYHLRVARSLADRAMAAAARAKHLSAWTTRCVVVLGIVVFALVSVVTQR